MNTKIELIQSVTADGIETSELNMRRPRVKDQLNAQNSGKTDADREIRLFATLCDVSPDSIMELDVADYSKLQSAYRDFLSPKGA